MACKNCSCDRCKKSKGGLWLWLTAGVLFWFITQPNSHADDWLCKTQGTQQVGQSFHSCGVAWAADENGARLASLENAKKEFTAICQASTACAGKNIDARPERTDCSVELGGVRCYRAVVFTVSEPAKKNLDQIQPYLGKSPSQPTISKGMTKSDLYRSFGAPLSIVENESLGVAWQQVFFKGKMCAFYGMFCTVTVENGVVKNFADFKPEFTELLN